jgi:serine/threonine-protein kinase
MKSIGKYQVIEEVGSSATGKTVRARDAFRNREFAVKILETVPGLSAEAKEKFCAHLAVCAELTHRHIAKIDDLGEVEEGIFVATEWRRGTNLGRFMRENRDLQLDQKLALMAQVAEGLAFAHSRGIAHGNLKPSNIFIDTARDVAILDFGTAQWLAALLAAGSRPEGLMANYLAPEQVLGRPFDARSDIFALGMMLYEFASGKYPFSADLGLIPREIVHSDPEPLSQLDPQVPPELEKLVALALRKDPGQRLQVAEEFASRLYVAAQQVRRSAPAAVAGPLPLAPPPEPVLPQPTPAPVSAPALAALPPAAAAPKVRERPQDAEPEERPWTARSYVAGTARPPVPVHYPPPPSTAPHSTSAHSTPPEPPGFQPPRSFLQPAVPPPAQFQSIRPPIRQTTGKTTKRVLIAAAGLVLAAVLAGSLVSRQNLRASQNKAPAATPVATAVTPAGKPFLAPAAAAVVHAPKHEEPEPDDAVSPEVSAKQVLNGPVRTLWESGRYAQALALVNQVLANDPGNDDARTWKKKLREAQAAEAALK